MAQPGAQGVLQPSGQWCLKTEQLKMGGKTNAHILQHAGGGGRLLAVLQKEAIWGAVWAQVPSQMSHQQLAHLGSHGPVHHLANRYIRFFHILILVNSSFFY